MTREYVESNVLFYLTAALAILFVYNWVGELTRGAEESRGTLTGDCVDVRQHHIHLDIGVNRCTFVEKLV